jgi:hypothetical protein
MKASLMTMLACALALSSPAIAQSSGDASKQDSAQQSQQQTSGQSSESKNQQQNVITINKLKQDLEDAGFSEVKILANFLRRAGQG